MSTARIIWLMCIVACMVGCNPAAPPVRITGRLSSNDVVEIERVVREEMVVRFHSASGRPIKSIGVTTNNLYEMDRGMLSRLSSEAATNPAAETRLREMQNHMQSEGPRLAVEVWYADKLARWGEAGYIVEKGTNGWKITAELFR